MQFTGENIKKKKILCGLVVGYLVLVIVVSFSGLYTSLRSGQPIQLGKYHEMGVIFENEEDVVGFGGGFSLDTGNPRNEPHNGIDIHFKNGSSILAACPGTISSKTITIHSEEGRPTKYFTQVTIRYSASLQFQYSFEMYTSNEDAEKQLDLLDVSLGQFVNQGHQIATFYGLDDEYHIHFIVNADREMTCPVPFLAEDSRVAYENLAAKYPYHNETFQLCY